MKTRLALVVMAAAVLSIPAQASAGLPLGGKIKEGVGVAGVSLGMTEAQAINKWGKPNSRKCTEIASTPYRTCGWTSGSANKFTAATLLTLHKKVVHILVFAGKAKTKKGVGNGTKIGKLKSAYPKVKFSQTCVIDRAYVGEIGGGHAVTSFRFISKKGALSGQGIDSIAIYDSAKAGWDGNPVGRPPNRATCPTGMGGPPTGDPNTDPPVDDPPAEDPPVDDPPVEDPPVDDPPVEDPPPDERPVT